MSYDLKVFFDRVRTTIFNGVLNAEQVEGIETILRSAPPDLSMDSLAYILATAAHETGYKFTPVTENLNYSNPQRITQVWPSRFPNLSSAQPYVKNPRGLANKVYNGRMGNNGPEDGWNYRGRGHVQITGKGMYDKAGKKIGVDLVNNPELSLVPTNSAKILIWGMIEGWFTGKKLSDFFRASGSLPTSARAIVNPDKNGAMISVIFVKFLQALKLAKTTVEGDFSEKAPEVPLPPPIGALPPLEVEKEPVIVPSVPTPLPIPPAPVEKTSTIFEKLKALLEGLFGKR